jgi:hypothetical protein
VAYYDVPSTKRNNRCLGRLGSFYRFSTELSTSDDSGVLEIEGSSHNSDCFIISSFNFHVDS